MSNFSHTLLGFLILILLAGCETNMDDPETSEGEVFLVRASKGEALLFSPLLTYAVNINSGKEFRLKNIHLYGDEVEWSSTGDWIVFSTLHTEGARAGGNSEIYLMSATENEPIQVTQYVYDDYQPAWSPGEDQIAYVADGRIQIVDVSCLLASRECVINPKDIAEGTHPDWSPTGGEIVFANQGQIYLIDTKGLNAPTKLTHNLDKCNRPNWSPDGNKIAFDCDGDIYVANSDGSGAINLTNGVGYNSSPQWSPDGEKISFISNREDYGLGKWLDMEGSVVSNAIFLMELDGTKQRRITLNNDEDVLWYAWIP